MTYGILRYQARQLLNMYPDAAARLKGAATDEPLSPTILARRARVSLTQANRLLPALATCGEVHEADGRYLV